MAKNEKEIRSRQTSPSDIWKAAQKSLDSMSPAERVNTLKEAGILTVAGNVSKPYRSVIRSK
ncbi:hypothetical protein EON80_26420 [bacterium]|nr:MAG: hypothetical protein EON80_26420 [bacterium]